ncbi:MAG: type II toxin-antitoxin system VapC family toxin [Methanobrevibacter sp.]|jgi:predicted nucleic acid-binding protein|nr:type II toxin-antitoxin system VapC family toxin [Methanobrevibacter sp.]
MIFLDVNFLISLFYNGHEKQKRAIEIWNNIKDKELVISNLVITEVITVLNMKLKQDKNELKEVYFNLIENFTILEDINLYDEAMEKVINYTDRIPFFDCVYIAMMEKLRIKEIISFDKHFDNKKGITRIH